MRPSFDSSGSPQRHELFSISTEVPRMYVVNIILDYVNQDGSAKIFRAKVDPHMWHGRMGHCNPRALQQLEDKDNSGVKLNRDIESGDCEVGSIANGKKSSHPLSDRPRAQTRLEIVHAYVWGKHPVESYSSCHSVVMFTDDKSRMRWGVPIKTKDETAEGLQLLVQDVADPEGLCIGNVHCDGGGFKGRFQESCVSLGIIIETNTSYIPEGNAIAERGFGTIMGRLTYRADCGLKHLKPRST